MEVNAVTLPIPSGTSGDDDDDSSIRGQSSKLTIDCERSSDTEQESTPGDKDQNAASSDFEILSSPNGQDDRISSSFSDDNSIRGPSSTSNIDSERSGATEKESTPREKDQIAASSGVEILSSPNGQDDHIFSYSHDDNSIRSPSSTSTIDFERSGATEQESTPGDKDPIATSSDIEVLSSPNGQDDRISSPSEQSQTSDKSQFLKKQDELQIQLDARKKQLFELSKKNLELQENEHRLKNVIEKMQADQVKESMNLTALTLELSKRLSLLESQVKDTTQTNNTFEGEKERQKAPYINSHTSSENSAEIVKNSDNLSCDSANNSPCSSKEAVKINQNEIEKNSNSSQGISNSKVDVHPNARSQFLDSRKKVEGSEEGFDPPPFTNSPAYKLPSGGNPVVEVDVVVPVPGSAQGTVNGTSASGNFDESTNARSLEGSVVGGQAPYTSSNVLPFCRNCEQTMKSIRCVNGMYLKSNSYLNYKKLMSHDKKQFIKIKEENGLLLYFGKFDLNYFDIQDEHYYEILGSRKLLVADNFIAKIDIISSYRINTNKTFEENRTAFLNCIVISKTVEDQLLDKRNKAYDDFTRKMKLRCSSVSDEINCSEDILQFSIIISQQVHPVDSMKIFHGIIQNDSISYDIRNAVEQLYPLETVLQKRNKCFPKFSHNVNIETQDLFNSLRKIVQNSMINHKQNLFQNCASQNLHSLCQKYISDLPEEKLLLVRTQDISLFSDLISLAGDHSQTANLNIPIEFVDNLWNKFYRKIQSISVKSLKSYKPVTNSIYVFLFKSLQNLISEISELTNIAPSELFLFDRGSCRLADSIPWPETTALSESLENRARLVFELMKHFEPGSCSEKKFSYTFKFLRDEKSGLKSWIKKLFSTKNKYLDNIAEERCIWLYVVDTGIAPILCKESSGPFKELSYSLVKGFVKLIQKARHDRFETFRIAAHNIVGFAHQIAPNFKAKNSKTQNVDLNILDCQIEFMNEIFTSCEDDFAVNHFSTLMGVYREYWDFRDSVLGKLLNQCEGGDNVNLIFEDDMEKIVLSLSAIMKRAFSEKVEVQHVIQFFRLFNEFLKHLKAIDFKWLISDRTFSFNVHGILKKITSGNITSFKVLDAERFVENLERNGDSIPKHFSIETVKKLLEIIEESLKKSDWSNEYRLKAAGDLFLAMGHSFAHFEDQVDYTDVEHFLRDSTTPFHSVVQNSDTYEDFKSRLDNVENFYLYSRKQNQIGVEEALNQSEKEVSRAKDNGFKTSFNREIVEACYDRYIKKLGTLENLDIPDILQALSEEMKNIELLPVEKWTPNFKQNVLPVLLAYLSAVWIVRESKDVSFINKKIEPHCVQIICILRLLGVDCPSDGLPKHFAQVLTGQGKSIILGLLSSLIALMGNKCNIVCYSPYLAKRDQIYFDPFMEVFDQFDVEGKVTYGTFDNLMWNTLTRRINGVEVGLSSVVEKLVSNKLQPLTMESIENSANTFLLIDEADVFFSDKYYGETLNPGVTLDMPALLEIQPKLWEIVERGAYEKSSVLKKIKNFIEDLFKGKKYEGFKNFISTTNALFETHLEKMIETAIFVSRAKNTDNILTQRFKINSDGIICYRDDLGFYDPTVSVGYFNVFNYFRLKKENFEHKYYRNYGFLKFRWGHIAYSNLPLLYKNILGVSGTLMNLNPSEISAIKRYGIETVSAMPTFFGKRNLEFDPSRDVSFYDSIESWHEGIFRSISKEIMSGRAVLVFFDTESEVKDFKAKFLAKIDRLHVLIGDEDLSTLEWRVSEAGVAQTVTLATRLMGRGIDYKSNDRSVEEKGGVHVIQTFFTLDEKEETQIKGRTARKDNKGSYEMVLCRIHLKEMKCSTTLDGNTISSYEGLCNARSRLAVEQGDAIHNKIKEAEKDHTLTMKFIDSLADYKPENRRLYLSRYPFVEQK